MLPALLALAFAQLPPDVPTHARELRAHANDAPFRAPPALRLDGALGPPRVVRIVYGYYPYWISARNSLRWDLLTHIVFFAEEIAADGTITANHGWPDANFVATAH